MTTPWPNFYSLELWSSPDIPSSRVNLAKTGWVGSEFLNNGVTQTLWHQNVQPGLAHVNPWLHVDETYFYINLKYIQLYPKFIFHSACIEIWMEMVLFSTLHQIYLFIYFERCLHQICQQYNTWQKNSASCLLRLEIMVCFFFLLYLILMKKTVPSLRSVKKHEAILAFVFLPLSKFIYASHTQHGEARNCFICQYIFICKTSPRNIRKLQS